MSDYLWDKSGPPDPEIERLEKLLAPLALPRKRHSPLRALWVPAAIAAALVLALVTWNRLTPHVRTLAGNTMLTARDKGQLLQTDSKSKALLQMNDVGEVEMEPDTRVRVLSIGADTQRLDLKRGTIHAEIWAPPGQFYVNTPSAVTVDLGCAYTLKVDDRGIGLVQVSFGWVAFESNGRESFIPAAAACETRPGRGPGVPYYEDSSAALRSAVHQYDLNGGDPAVRTILAEARKRDALTLWHLLRRVPPDQRASVYDRMSALIQIPSTVTRDGVLLGNSAQIDALWDSLDLGDTSWWRMWKSRTPQ